MGNQNPDTTSTRPSMLAIFSPLLATGSMQREAFVITADTSGLRFRHTAQTLTSLGFVVWPFAPVDARDSRVLEIEKKYIRVNESLGMARRAISLTLTHAELWYAAPRLGCTR